MASREARIGFLLGALAGAGAALVWASKPERMRPVLDRVRSAAAAAESRVREVDRLVGDVTEMAREQAHAVRKVASDTTHRVDAVADVVQRDLIHSIRELGALVRGLKDGLERIFPRRVA